jgi:hypothetical protein
MVSSRDVIAAGALALAGMLGAAADTPALAGSDPVIVTRPKILLTCPNPEPQFMEYAKGSVPYHPELSVISLTGTVKNVGGAKFIPGPAPQAIELWIKWGNNAGQKLKSVPLLAMPGGAVATIQASVEPGPYLQKVASFGLPKLTLMVNTNAAGIGGGKDCALGEANLTWIYGPNPGELQAMGITP